jgi:hypothetical protein
MLSMPEPANNPRRQPDPVGPAEKSVARHLRPRQGAACGQRRPLALGSPGVSRVARLAGQP